MNTKTAAGLDTPRGTLVPVPPKMKTRPPPGRYSQEAVALEVARAIARGGRGTHKAVAAHLGMSSQQLSHRMAADIARFSIEDVGLIADYFKAPPGRPFIPWELASAIFRQG